MKCRVFKFIVPVERDPVVQVNGLVKVLHFGAQGDNLCMWAMVNPEDKALSTLRLLVVGTGHEFEVTVKDSDTGLVFLQTVQMNLPSGQLVWHIFARE
jgi:hypothetical protein